MRFVVGSRYGSRGRVSAQGTGHSLMTGGLSTTAVEAAMAATVRKRTFMGPPGISFSSQHPSLQRGQTPANGSIKYAVTDAYHYPAQDPGVGTEVGPHLAAQRLRETIDDLFLCARVGLIREGDAGVHAVQLHV